MPSHVPGDEDYECPQCYSNAYPCGCYTKDEIIEIVMDSRLEVYEQFQADQDLVTKLRQDLNRLVGRIKRHYRENPLRARIGALTYRVEGDQLKIGRWAYRDGHINMVPLDPNERAVLARLIRSLAFFYVKMKI